MAMDFASGHLSSWGAFVASQWRRLKNSDGISYPPCVPLYIQFTTPPREKELD